MPNLSQRDGVYVLDIGESENRFSPEWIESVGGLLDHVLTTPAPLVVAARGKFYSNGLDLDWIGAHPDQFAPYVAGVQALFARLLTFPVPTATAINGHAFGAGAMLALSCDWRIMREDRGYFCLPEVDIQIPFTAGMAALVQCKTTARTAVDAMTTGRRFTASEAHASGLIDGTASDEELLVRTIAQVAPLAGKSVETLGAIKSTMFADVVAALVESPAI